MLVQVLCNGRQQRGDSMMSKFSFALLEGSPFEVSRHRVVFTDACTLQRYVPAHAISTATAITVASRQVSAMCLMLLISRTYVCEAYTLFTVSSTWLLMAVIFNRICHTAYYLQYFLSTGVCFFSWEEEPHRVTSGSSKAWDHSDMDRCFSHVLHPVPEMLRQVQPVLCFMLSLYTITLPSPMPTGRRKYLMSN